MGGGASRSTSAGLRSHNERLTCTDRSKAIGGLSRVELDRRRQDASHHRRRDAAGGRRRRFRSSVSSATRDRRSRRIYRRARCYLLRAPLPDRRRGGHRRPKHGSKCRWSRWSTTAGGASFAVEEIGRYSYTVSGWVDHFKTWSRDLAKRVEAEPGRRGRPGHWRGDDRGRRQERDRPRRPPGTRSMPSLSEPAGPDGIARGALARAGAAHAPPRRAPLRVHV